MQKYLFLILFLFSIIFKGFGQDIAAPEIEYVSVNSQSGKIIIRWSFPTGEQIDGFIVKRFIRKAEGVADNTYNTVAIIENPSTFSYTDTSTVYGEAQPEIQSEKYRLAAFRYQDGTMKLSIMSEIHATVLPSAEFDICSESNIISWNSYTGWNSSDFFYDIYSKNTGKEFEKIGTVSPVDTSFIHSQVIENKSYTYLIKTINNNSFVSESSIDTCFTKAEKIETKISSAKAITNGNILDLQFDFDENDKIFGYSILKMQENGFDTIANFSRDTRNSLFWKDTLEDVFRIYNYFAVSKNFCGRAVGFSDTISNLVIKGTLKDEYPPVNEILIQNASLNFEKYEYSIFRSFSEDGFDLAGIINDLSFEDNISEILENALSLEKFSGEFCYYLQETGKNSGEIRRSSNVVCLNKQTDLFVPNAFNPESTLEENRKFRPKNFYLDSYKMVIFNIQGHKIFETSDISNGWDGTYKSAKVATGVYSYIITYKNTDNKLIIKKGHVTVF